MKRYWKNYLLLAAASALAVTMISLPVIYFDCNLNGADAAINAASGGCDITVDGVGSGALKYFENRDEFTAEWSGGSILITASGSKDAARRAVSGILSEEDIEYSGFVCHYTFRAAESYEYTAYSAVSMLFALLGIFTLTSAYRFIYIRRGNQFETLIRLGIKRKALSAVILSDIISAALPGYIIGNAFSNIIMAALTSMRQSGADIYGMYKPVYRFGFGANIAIFLIAAASVTVTWRITVRNAEKNRIRHIQFSDRGRKVFAQCQREKTSAVRVLSYSELVRRGSSYRMAGIISSSVLILVTYLVMSISAEAVSLLDGTSAAVYTGFSYSSSDAEDERLILDACSLAADLPGTAGMSFEARYDALCADLKENDNLIKIYGPVPAEGEYAEFRYAVSAVALVGKAAPGDGEAWVSPASDRVIDGDRLMIYNSEKYSRGIADKPYELKISGEYGQASLGAVFAIYVNSETFRALTGREPVPDVIYLTRDMNVTQEDYIDQISYIFGSLPSAHITDSEALTAEKENNKNASRPFVYTLCASLSLSAFITVCLSMALDAERRRDELMSLAGLGADKLRLRITAVLPAFVRAIVSLLIGIGAGTGFALMMMSGGGTGIINAYSIMYLLIVPAVYIIIHILPYLTLSGGVIRAKTICAGKENI